MAKFCTKCGSELVDGVCPNCKEEKVVVVAEQSIDIKESCIDCVNVFKNIFTRPLDAIKNFVSENKFIAGIIMAVVAALSTGIYKIATLKNLYSSSKSASDFTSSDLSSLIDSALSGNFGISEPEYLKEFMTTFAINAVQYALIIVLGYLIISKLFKGTASIKEMVAAVGISLSVVLAANVLNSILVFIDGEFIANLRVYVASFASILSTLILFGSVKQVAGINENKLFVTIASMSVFATAIMDLIQKLFD